MNKNFEFTITELPQGQPGFLSGCAIYGTNYSEKCYWLNIYNENKIIDSFPFELIDVKYKKYKIARCLPGFSGPSGNYFSNSNFNKLVDCFDHLNVICLYLLSRCPSQNKFSSYRTNYKVVLDRDLPQIINSFRRDSRSRCNKYKSFLGDYSIELGSKNVGEFSLQYKLLSEKHNFPEIYCLDYKKLTYLLKSNFIQLLTVRNSNSQWVGGCILAMQYSPLPTIDYLYSCYSNAIKDSNRIMLLKLYEYGISNKFEEILLGGGISENDSLARFKEGMGGTAVPCTVYKFIFNEDSYNFLSKSRPTQQSNYFPSFSLE